MFLSGVSGGGLGFSPFSVAMINRHDLVIPEGQVSIMEREHGSKQESG